MKLDKIANTILQEAEIERENIISTAHAQASEIIESKKAELEGINLEKLTHFEQDIEKMVVENVASKRLTAKREVQIAKDEVINNALKKVQEMFYDLRNNERKYTFLMTNLYEEAIKHFKNDDFEVVCSKEDEKLMKSIVKKGNVIISNEVKAGLIVKSKNKRMLIDFTFDSLLRDRESEIKEVLSKNIF